MAPRVDEGSSSSSSNPTPRWKYHVFLSFRGEDTRKSFTDHLYATLRQKGIITFRDDEELRRGHVIKHNLLEAIEESFCAVVILSPNYAFSSWCLDELVKILCSKKEFGLLVFPISYDVDPSDVRHQRGSFAKALGEHEQKFKQDKDKVQRWRDALQEVASLSGWDSKNWHETKLIENVIENIWSNLRYELPADPDILVGIESKIAEMDSLVANGLNDVQFIGIWGMGGIGKTTLARVVYERIFKDFEIHCFLSNVREASEKDGLLSLQRKLLSHMNVRSMEIDNCYEGRKLIRNILCNRKVLLVLDDVSDISQLESLAGKQGWFGGGSRIIITTRDTHLLSLHGVSVKFEIKVLSDNESLQLFYQKVFRGNQPKQDYSELSRTVIEYAKGLPLALKVLGSFLCERTVLEWKDALAKLRKIPPNDILKVLKVSYDALEDDEKAIFLDIACFFKGMAKDRVIQILQNCGLHSIIAIKVLIDKSLAVITSEGSLWMHDMIQEMGKNIVVQESPNDISKRSRLWSLEDANHVLEKNKGTETTQGIVLTLENSYDAYWDPKAFLKLSNLRLLMISNRLHLPHCHLNLPYGLKFLPNALKVLEWVACPLDALPSEVPLDELVDLKMQLSNLKQLWRGTQLLGRLKSIDLSHSKYLRRTPNFDGIPNLERFILEGCINLIEVHPSLGRHKKLVIVDLKDCKSIKTLPRKLEMDCLETIILSGCSQVRQLPEFGKSMERLSTLDLEETGIAKLPQSLQNLSALAILNLRNCKNLGCLPNVIQYLKSIRVINFSGCSKLSRMPDISTENMALEELDASGTAITEVPSSILHLRNMKILSFHGCIGQTHYSSSWNLPFLFRWMFRFKRPSISSTRLMLPPSLSSLSSLKELDLSHCNLCDESLPHDLRGLSSLRKLDLRGNYFVNLPAGFISNLLRLEYVFLNNCPRLQSLPQLPSNLLATYASDCSSMNPSLASQQFWDFFQSFESQDGMAPKQTRIFNTPGSEIPPWFHNQNYFCAEDVIGLFKPNVSFITDVIPDYCHSSAWWGVAVCLALEGDLASAPFDHYPPIIRWNSRDPELGFTKKWISSKIYEQYSCRHQLFFMFVPGHDEKKIQMIFSTDKFGNKGRTKFEIKKCGWHVLCKEDVETWRRTKYERGSCSSNEIELERELIGEEDGSTSDVEPQLPIAKRRKLE